MMKSIYIILTIALDDVSNLEINEDKYRIITSIEEANAWKCHWKLEHYISKTKKIIKYGQTAYNEAVEFVKLLEKTDQKYAFFGLFVRFLDKNCGIFYGKI